MVNKTDKAMDISKFDKNMATKKADENGLICFLPYENRLNGRDSTVLNMIKSTVVFR